MSRVLFLSNIALANPTRGTPLHICSLLRAIRKEHSLFICVHSVPDDLKDIFIPYPSQYGWKKLFILIRILRRNRISHVFTATDNGLVAPIVLKLFFSIRIIDEMHGISCEELIADGKIGRIKYFYFKYKTWILLNFYDKVIVMLKNAAYYYGHTTKDWIVAPVAVNITDVPDASRSSHVSDTYVLGYMGNTRWYQGLSYMIEAARMLRDSGLTIRLNLILSGNTEEVEQQLIKSNLYDKAIIHKNVSHTEAFRLIENSSVLILPRPRVPVTEYSFPSKLPEYLATGLPIILTDVGPVDELRDNLKQFCEIIPSQDIAIHITKAVHNLYNTDQEILHERGRQARLWVEKYFSWEERGRLINQCLQD